MPEMDAADDRIKEAIRNTEILRAPKQSLYTFGTTNIYYYLLTEPAYSELIKTPSETVIREGRVIAEKPKIVTPYYLSNLDGFSAEARSYFRALADEYGANMPGLYYSYRNEPKELNIVSDSLPVMVDKLNARIDRSSDPMAAIIKGEDTLWDVSLMKFIFEITRNSVPGNLEQMQQRGVLNMDPEGIPADATRGIEELFGEVSRGESQPGVLQDELVRWGVFEKYEDRFLSIFKKKR